MSLSFLLIKAKKIQARAYFELFLNLGLPSLKPGASLLEAKNLARALEPKPRLIPPLESASKNSIHLLARNRPGLLNPPSFEPIQAVCILHLT